MLLAIYVERVNPGEFGVAQPWNYLFKLAYWKPKKKSSKSKGFYSINLDGQNDENVKTNHWIEQKRYSRRVEPILTVKNLTKVKESYFILINALECSI